MSQKTADSQCSGGNCSSFVLFVERKIAVGVVSVLVVFAGIMSACSGRILMVVMMRMSVFGISISSCEIL